MWFHLKNLLYIKKIKNVLNIYQWFSLHSVLLLLALVLCVQGAIHRKSSWQRPTLLLSDSAKIFLHLSRIFTSEGQSQYLGTPDVFQNCLDENWSFFYQLGEFSVWLTEFQIYSILRLHHMPLKTGNIILVLQTLIQCDGYMGRHNLSGYMVTF